jgi:hypothetical protein
MERTMARKGKSDQSAEILRIFKIDDLEERAKASVFARITAHDELGKILLKSCSSGDTWYQHLCRLRIENP